MGKGEGEGKGEGVKGNGEVEALLDSWWRSFDRFDLAEEQPADCYGTSSQFFIGGRLQVAHIGCNTAKTPNFASGSLSNIQKK